MRTWKIQDAYRLGGVYELLGKHVFDRDRGDREFCVLDVSRVFTVWWVEFFVSVQ